jgi:hypothetical protein
MIVRFAGFKFMDARQIKNIPNIALEESTI